MLNIDDKDEKKPEVEKQIPDLTRDSSSFFDKSSLPPTPQLRRRISPKMRRRTWNLDSDSDEDNPVPPIPLNIREDSDLNELSVVKKKKKSRHRDSMSEEDIQYRGSRIRQKLRKKRSSPRSDSDT